MRSRPAGLTRRFGGLVAVDTVNLAVRPGEVHCIIGPNGAGKTTLINLLSGDVRPSAGTIRLNGRDIAGLPAHAISQMGMGRSYQRTNIFAEFTVAENCWLGAQSRLSSSMRFVKPAAGISEVRARAERAIDLAGLTARAATRASALSHGEQRQLETRR